MKLFKSKQEKIDEKERIAYIESLPKCDGCKLAIYPEDKQKHSYGKHFHLKCYRDFRKYCVNAAFGINPKK